MLIFRFIFVCSASTVTCLHALSPFVSPIALIFNVHLLYPSVSFKRPKCIKEDPDLFFIYCGSMRELLINKKIRNIPTSKWNQVWNMAELHIIKLWSWSTSQRWLVFASVVWMWYDTLNTCFLKIPGLSVLMSWRENIRMLVQMGIYIKLPLSVLNYYIYKLIFKLFL